MKGERKGLRKGYKTMHVGNERGRRDTFTHHHAWSMCVARCTLVFSAEVSHRKSTLHEETDRVRLGEVTPLVEGRDERGLTRSGINPGTQRPPCR